MCLHPMRVYCGLTIQDDIIIVETTSPDPTHDSICRKGAVGTIPPASFCIFSHRPRRIISSLRQNKTELCFLWFITTKTLKWCLDSRKQMHLQKEYLTIRSIKCRSSGFFGQIPVSNYPFSGTPKVTPITAVPFPATVLPIQPPLVLPPISVH